MATTIRQASFIGGEIAPSLHGRVDLARYQEALATLKNAFVQYHGGIANRPGLRFIEEAKYPDRRVRLIEFAFNTEQTYVLEFGDQYMRVIKNGGIVIDSQTGGIFEIATPYSEADLFRLKFTQSADVMTLCHPDYEIRELTRTADDAWQLTTKSLEPSIPAPSNGAGTPKNAGDETYYYRVTAVTDDETLEESLPHDITVTNAEDLSVDGADIELSWDAVAGAGSYNVYRDSSGLYGYIGTTESTSFRDIFYDPDVSDVVAKSRNPFDSAGNYPSTATYFQQRLVFGATRNRPQTIFTSKSSAFSNFTYSTPYRDDDAITFTIASREVNEVRHLIPLRELLTLTSGGEWVVQGDVDGILTPTSINVETQGYRGASHVEPIVVGNSAIYVQARGNVIRDLQYEIQVDGFQTRDLTIFAPHFFEGREVVDWCWAEIPNYLVWVVLDDGTLLSLTYVAEQDVWGWAQHETDGAVESVASISEGSEDAVYMVVRRTVNGQTRRYLERLESRLVRDVRDVFFVDSGLSYDGRIFSGAVTASASSYSYQDDVTLTLAGAIWPTWVADEVVELTGSDGEQCRFVVASRDSDTVVTAIAQRDVPASLQNTEASSYSIAVKDLSGLQHLEGKTVSILADGNVEPQQVVQSGAITLPRAASVIHVGLPYTTEIETLEVEAVNEESLRDKRKLVNSVTMVVEKSRGIFVGDSPNNLTKQGRLIEWKQRDNEALGEPTQLYTGSLKFPIESSWNNGGKVRLVQTDPLPLTVLSILPRITVGGPQR